MAKLSDFQRDSAVIETGDWVKNIPGAGPDISILTRGMDCVDAISLKAELEVNRPIEVIRDAGKSALADIQDNAKVIARICAKEIKGIDDFDIPEDEEEFEKILLEPDNRPLLNLFLMAARMVGRKNQQKKEVMAKNSQSGTTTT